MCLYPSVIQKRMWFAKKFKFVMKISGLNLTGFSDLSDLYVRLANFWKVASH